MRSIRSRHGTAAAYLALFVALGGTSYAAISIPRNSVGNAQLKNGAVTNAKVRGHSLTSSAFRSGSLPKGATGSAGPQGSPGPQGPAGTAGTAAGSVFAYVASDGTVDPANSSGITSANIVHTIQGVYCVTGLPVAPKNIQVTPVLSFGGPVSPAASLGTANQCALGTQASIVLLASSTSAAVNQGFSLEIH